MKDMDKVTLVEIIKFKAEFNRNWISATEESKEAHKLIALALDDLAIKVEKENKC